MDLLTSDFDYFLPPELIAQNPAERRDLSRLMVINRQTGDIAHQRFADLPDLLAPGDLAIANRSRVIPARLTVRRAGGGEVELLLLRKREPAHWTALARPSRRLRPGQVLAVDGSGLRARVEESLGQGEWLIRFDGNDAEDELKRVGRIPLPPYIRHSSAPDDRYQTVYGDCEGSVAAPTAGLHFSPELIAGLKARGVSLELVTLHVGPGTFRPVTTERVRDHKMQPEWGEIPGSVAAAADEIRASGGRLVAIGTTTVRLLESAAQDGKVMPFRGETGRFIRPGYRFQVIDSLVTNFHLPRSSLLMLVSAFGGRDLIMRAYQIAIEQGYRFYSFGDAMLIV
jgi:S-adenosylmethionine:tRNA ribosyltransferase-isomerase